MVFVGLASYTNSTSGYQSVIDYINANKLNIYRLAFTPSWKTGSHLSYSKSLIQTFLTNSPKSKIIVDPNHLYPGSTSYTEFEANIATATNDCLKVCADFPDNQRVIVELVNEYYIQSNYVPLIQPMINAIRNAGYSNPLLVNKYANFAWNCLAFNDPLNNFFAGTHKYFNTLTSGEVADMEAHMQQAITLGYKLINTEVGAADSSADFATDNVGALDQFIDWCTVNGVGNCVWNNIDIQYMATYASLGLSLPQVSNGGGQITLPYHNALASLDELSIVNGIWSI